MIDYLAEPSVLVLSQTHYPGWKALVDGAELADSWATDAHKWLNVPYDNGIAFCAHPAAHRAALVVEDLGRGKAGVDFHAEGLRLLRSDVVADPAHFRLGTKAFDVEIAADAPVASSTSTAAASSARTVAASGASRAATARSDFTSLSQNTACRRTSAVLPPVSRCSVATRPTYSSSSLARPRQT